MEWIAKKLLRSSIWSLLYLGSDCQNLAEFIKGIKPMKISANWLRKPSTQSIMEILISDGHEAYFVGGCVRILYLTLRRLMLTSLLVLTQKKFWKL